MLRIKKSADSPADRAALSQNETNPSFPTFRRAFKATWKFGRRFLVWGLALALVAHTGINLYASILVNRELAEIRAKGEPFNFAEMAPAPVPDAQNAAVLYQQAYEAIKANERNANGRKVTSARGSRDDDAKLRENQAAIRLIRRGADMSQCRFPVKWDDNPIQIVFPHYKQQRELARLLELQAQWEAHHGNHAVALQDVRRMYTIADQLSAEPILIGFLAARAIHGLADSTLNDILSVSPVPASTGQDFLQSLPRTDWSGAFRTVFLGERTFSIWVFSNVPFSPANLGEFGGSETSPPSWVATPLAWLWRPFAKLDEVYILRLWRQLIASITPMQVPAPERTGQDFDAEVMGSPSYAVMTKLLFPVFSRARVSRDKLEVAERQREVAMALSAYRAKYGVYPQTLAQAEKNWGRPLPLDPYTKRSFGYQLKNSGIWLYSLGPNQVDDQGLLAFGKGIAAKNAPAGADDLLWAPETD